MAFGRDGSELELMIYDLQNKRLTEALELIIEKSGDDEIIRIARGALKEAERISKKLGEG
jgi:hypothetical protein